ncbi:MAG: hypothetical protein SGPRY_001088, partial [Prymnesium sp.]
PLHEQPLHMQPLHMQLPHMQPLHMQPLYKQPLHMQPLREQPPHEQPPHMQPLHMQPLHMQPLHEQPPHMQPLHEQPLYKQPLYKQPLYKQTLSRAMPSIFIAGPAKSGSTFLWDCIQQTFHPDELCGAEGTAGWADVQCGSQRFVLPALVGSALQPSCLRFSKESAFWRYWGRKPQVSWRRYGGPIVPLAMWERRRVKQTCAAGRRHLEWTPGPRAFVGHRWMEDLCMHETSAHGEGGKRGGGEVEKLGGGEVEARCATRVAYDQKMPAECAPVCSPCDLHPGWMNNFNERCPFPPTPCDSLRCARAP